MAYETKVILMLLAQQIARCESVKEAYDSIARAASVEGVKLPSYEEILATIKRTLDELFKK